MMLRLVRHLSTRAEIRRSVEAAKSNIKRSTQINELHKMVADFERSGGNLEVEKKEEYETESMIGEMMLRKEVDFGKVMSKRNQKTMVIEKGEGESGKSNFPLKSRQIVERRENPIETQKEQEIEDQKIDRGFFIEADVLVDEYIAGSSMDLDPGDEMVSSCQYFGKDDAVEQISFQLPGQKTSEKEEYEIGEEEHMMNTVVGTVCEEMAASKRKCTGCGANFHCKDSSFPGFVPAEILEKIERRKETKSLCKRCHLLQEHNFLLNVNVCEVDYSSMMSELKKQPEALVILIVDVTDLPGSIYPQLAEVIGSRKPMIVVGNKVDLLPPDARSGYMYRFKKTVERAIEKCGLLDKFNIVHTALTSAKTGHGIEELITEIYMKYTNVKMGMRGNIYLVGCTNAGKSTMFNALLQSDLCKVRAVNLVDRATTSIWPGTTMSLLKFPVMKPSPYKLEMRRRRLMTHRAWVKKEMYARRILLEETGDDRFAINTEVIQNSFEETEEELQPMALKMLTEGETQETQKGERKWSLKDDIFAKGKWCYDTPGTVNSNQVLSMFTLDELLNVVPRKVLKPRTAILKKGESLLIAGVGRIDIENAVDNILLTTFVNDKLPLNVMETGEVEGFLDKWNGKLVVPTEDKDRMDQWEGLGEGRTFEIKGRRGEGCCDIVLSSIGWIMINTEKDCTIKAFSPAGKGLTARIQPILPFSADLRGKRIAGSKFYKVEPIKFPVNLKRRKAKFRSSRT